MKRDLIDNAIIAGIVICIGVFVFCCYAILMITDGCAQRWPLHEYCGYSDTIK